MYFNVYKEKILYSAKSEPASTLYCTLAGITYPNPEYTISRTPCDTYVFEYVISGKGYIEYNEALEEVKTGDFYCIKKGCNLTCTADKNDPCEKIWINIDGDIVSKIYDFFALDPVYITKSNVFNHFIAIHDKLSGISEVNKADTYAEIMSHILTILVCATKKKLFPSNSGINSLEERIRSYIDANIYNEISLEMIAEQFSVTRMHVIRIFKQKYGVTPIQYMLDKKISIAKSLLRDTVMPIKEISELLRYSNTQHFSGSFKKSVGCTPNQYRQSN